MLLMVSMGFFRAENASRLYTSTLIHVLFAFIGTSFIVYLVLLSSLLTLVKLLTCTVSDVRPGNPSHICRSRPRPSFELSTLLSTVPIQCMLLRTATTLTPQLIVEPPFQFPAVTPLIPRVDARLMCAHPWWFRDPRRCVVEIDENQTILCDRRRYLIQPILAHIKARFLVELRCFNELTSALILPAMVFAGQLE